MSIMAQDLIDRVIERTKQEIISHEQHEKTYKKEEKAEKEQPEKSVLIKEPEEIETRLQDYEIQGIEEGMIVSGVVAKIDKEEVLVSVFGCKSEGVIPLNELSIRAFSSPEDVVSIGETIRVYVLAVEGSGG